MTDGDGDRSRDARSLHRQGVMVVLVAVVVLYGGLAAAAVISNSVPVSGVIPVGTQSGMNVDVEDHGGELVLEDPWLNSTALQIETANGNATVVAQSNGDANVRLVQITGSETRLTEIDASNTDIVVDPEDKAAVVVGGGVTAVDYHSNSEVAVGDGNTDFEYAASSSGSVTIGGLPANDQFEAITGNGEKIQTFSTDGSGRATLSVPTSSKTSVKIIDADEPEVTSASPKDGGQVQSTNTELEATVKDADFATSNGDTVTVTFYLNGNQVKQVDITSNQTVTANVEPPLGETSTWYVEVEDGYGQQNSIAQRSFDVPSQLKIFKERSPTELVDGQNVNITVRFFDLDDESSTVVTREAKNGAVNLTNLPADRRFVVTVDTANFSYRRIVIDSLYETNKIYLLNDSATSSRVVFELQDPTGEFPPSETILYVEKPIEKDYDGDSTNETRYQTIAGDTFGASARFPAILLDGTRYRLRVATASGSNERILGFYSVYADTIEPLKIQRIEPQANESNSGVVYGGLEGKGNNTQLAVRFRGGTENTTVEYNVTDSNGNVVVPNTTTTAEQFAHLYPADPKKTYTVNYEIRYADGEVVGDSFKLGRLDGIADRFNIDPQILSMLSWVMILATMGLIVLVDPTLAPAGGTGMAAGLSILGTVAIPAPLLGVSGAVAVLTLFGGRA